MESPSSRAFTPPLTLPALSPPPPSHESHATLARTSPVPIRHEGNTHTSQTTASSPPPANSISAAALQTAPTQCGDPSPPHARQQKFAPRSKRFRFSDSADILLLKAVSVAEAHVAPWGRKGILFEEAHSTFVSTAPPALLGDKDPPCQKSLEDWFKVVISKRRSDNKKSMVSSGQVEVYAEMETLLDDLILDMDENAEGERAAKDQRLEKEKRLAVAGEELRSMALNRTARGGGETAGHTVEVEADNRSQSTASRALPGGGRNPNVGKTRRRINYKSDEDTTEALVRDVESRREQDSRRVELEERRYELEKRRVEEEGKRFDVVQASKRRKLDVEERKRGVEIEERKMAILERSKMIDVFAALANKLQ